MANSLCLYVRDLLFRYSKRLFAEDSDFYKYHFAILLFLRPAETANPSVT